MGENQDPKHLLCLLPYAMNLHYNSIEKGANGCTFSIQMDATLAHKHQFKTGLMTFVSSYKELVYRGIM